MSIRRRRVNKTGSQIHVALQEDEEEGEEGKREPIVGEL